MKKCLIIVFFVYSIGVLYAQPDSLKGFWGIDWKTTIEQAKKTLTDQTLSNETDKMLEYDDATFNNKPAIIILLFNNDKFYEGQAVFVTDRSSWASEIYDTLSRNLSEKYGAPTIDDGNVINWLFKDNNIIQLESRINNFVYLFYINEDMYKLVPKDSNAPASKDL